MGGIRMRVRDRGDSIVRSCPPDQRSKLLLDAEPVIPQSTARERVDDGAQQNPAKVWALGTRLGSSTWVSITVPCLRRISLCQTQVRRHKSRVQPAGGFCRPFLQRGNARDR